MHTLTLVTFVLALGLSLRLTRLLVDDSITDPLRAATARRMFSDGKVDAETGAPAPHPFWHFAHELISCPWCMGVWTSAASFGWACAAPRSLVFIWVAAAASASWLVGLASLATYKLAED